MHFHIRMLKGFKSDVWRKLSPYRRSSLWRKLTPCGTGYMVWRDWGDARPLVLLHGASGSWTHWIRNIAPLATRFRVLVPDLPGFGDSDLPSEPHTADMLAGLVASGFDTVVPPSMEFDLAGFSFGGIIAGLVAARMGMANGTESLAHGEDSRF
jgi:pimeloyl-ACP methyl ester carboxylesterase